MSLMILVSGCSSVCHTDYGKCDKKFEKNHPIVNVLRITNGLFSQ